MPIRATGRSRAAFAVAAAGLAVTALLAGGCASIRLADEQKAYHRAQLDAYRYASGCLDVWPGVLSLLGEKGYPLQGRDRAYAGQGKESAFSGLVDQGYETRAVEGGGLVVKTGWLDDAEGASQYLVTGNPGQPTGCVVTFTRRWRGTVDPSNVSESPDWRMQQELLKRTDPAAATRIEAGAPKG